MVVGEGGRSTGVLLYWQTFGVVNIENLAKKVRNSVIYFNVHADDIVLLSPSATGLSLLLHVCGKYGLEHDQNYQI